MTETSSATEVVAANDSLTSSEVKSETASSVTETNTCDEWWQIDYFPTTDSVSTPLIKSVFHGVRNSQSKSQNNVQATTETSETKVSEIDKQTQKQTSGKSVAKTQPNSWHWWIAIVVVAVILITIAINRYAK